MAEDAPTSCTGNQPTEITVRWNNQAWLCGGGGPDNCYWTDGSGFVDVYLDEMQRAWTIEISGSADGGPSAGTKGGASVAGTYSNGAVVS